jgi:hypothetical protein
MARYNRSTAQAARSYLGRLVRTGKLAPGDRAPSTYTDAYAVRVANAVAGGKGRQAGRGHGSTREHPRQFTFVYAAGAARRVGSGRFVEGQRQFREYRDPSALFAWMKNRLPGGIPVRISARGVVRETYTALTYAGGRARFAVPQPGDDDVRELEWRSIYTGDQSGSRDLNDVEIATIGDLWAAVNRVFVPGTVDLFQLNWH